MSAPGRQRLTSWKEIAAYLGRDVRTVLRWQKDRGLPVRRIPGGTGRVVFAYTDELDAWAAGELKTPQSTNETTSDNRDAAPRWRVRWTVASAVLVCLVAATSAVLLWGASDNSAAVARVTFEPPVLRAFASDGRVVWSRTFANVNAIQMKTFVADMNGDGHDDVLVCLYGTVAGGGAAGTAEIVALNHRGATMWRQTIADTLTFGAGTYSAPWAAENFLVYDSGGERFVAVALHQDTWWPGLLAVFNSRGQRTATFVNAGWIRTVSASPDGRYLLAGGVNNARNGAAFAILDARHPEGSSPEDAGSAYECRSCPPGRPLHYYVIPWSDIVDPTVVIPGIRGGHPLAYADGSVQLRAVEYDNAEQIVDLTPSLAVSARRVSDGFWAWHAKLERERILTHGRGQCPLRRGPSLLEWTTARGWCDVP